MGYTPVACARYLHNRSSLYYTRQYERYCLSEDTDPIISRFALLRVQKTCGDALEKCSFCVKWSVAFHLGVHLLPFAFACGAMMDYKGRDRARKYA